MTEPPSLIWQGSLNKTVLYSSKLLPTLPSFLTRSKTRLNNSEFCKLCENLQFLSSSGEYAELAVVFKYEEHIVLELAVTHTVSYTYRNWQFRYQLIPWVSNIQSEVHTVYNQFCTLTATAERSLSPLDRAVSSEGFYMFKQPAC